MTLTPDFVRQRLAPAQSRNDGRRAGATHESPVGEALSLDRESALTLQFSAQGRELPDAISTARRFVEIFNFAPLRV